MRTKDKIEKYLDKLIKKYNGSIIESEKSRYYSLRGKVLRISDHVAHNSSGNMSIILDNSNSGYYMIHGHTSGNVSILNYNQTKEFTRTFMNCTFIYVDMGPQKPFPKSPFTKDVFNYFQSNFTSKQLKQIVMFFKGDNKKKEQYLELLTLVK